MISKPDDHYEELLKIAKQMGPHELGSGKVYFSRLKPDGLLEEMRYLGNTPDLLLTKRPWYRRLVDWVVRR